MIRDANSKFDDYSISPTIRQILLHWVYELTEKYFFQWVDKLMYENESWKIVRKILWMRDEKWKTRNENEDKTMN